MREVREVRYGSSEWEAVLELRREVLRRPLGLEFTEDQLREEESQSQLALYDDGQLVACALLLDASERTGKVRQVAVVPSVQRKGYGREIMEACERLASSRGMDTIVLHARETAVPFYSALGYSVEGDSFIEATIPHRRMVKALA